MEEVLKFIDECVSTFYCYFNYGKPNTEKILPFCRPAVEKFIFNKIYFLLSDIYNCKYKNENKAFNDQQIKIRSTLSLAEIMNYSEVFNISNRLNQFSKALLNIVAFPTSHSLTALIRSNLRLAQRISWKH
jgi:hypothetical protein